jgi:hypothetical protein
LNTLSFSFGFLLYEITTDKYDGYADKGMLFTKNNVVKGMPANWYVPQLTLNYGFMYVMKMKKYFLMPSFGTGILNFNKFIGFGFPDHEPLMRRSDYYKELFFGLAIMKR